MIEFQCDYAEGAHPKILERMIETNMDQTPGYGLDPYCDEARRLIRKACGRENIDVQFLVGGTQTNTTIICSVLRPYQGVLTAASGHINVHESGAIEATGHKVLALPCGREGKITAEQIKAAYEAHMNDSSAEHMVQPGMVYISNPTENGTIYYRNELEAISRVCHECGLPLFLDGARLGYGLMAADNDIILEDIARLCDVFYIGGTKVGALFGEAVVITNPAISKDFRYMIKQRGGMLAKGRLLGIQFQTLFEDGRYIFFQLFFDLINPGIQQQFQQFLCVSVILSQYCFFYFPQHSSIRNHLSLSHIKMVLFFYHFLFALQLEISMYCLMLFFR